MKYYWKHLVRVIRQKPLQPLLMLFILLLSFVVENTAISATEAIHQESADERLSSTGSAQVTVAVGSNSPSRFLTEKAVTEVLPQAEVTGSFALPFLHGEELVTGYALDLKKAESFFNFAFTEIQEISKAELDQAIFVTAEFAKEQKIRVGDLLSLSLFGEEETYLVKGISEKPFLGDADVICDISGVVSGLVGSSKLLSVFTDEVFVYGKLYVRCQDMTDEEIKNALLPSLENYSLSTVDRSGATSDVMIFRGIAIIILLFCLIISLAVLIGCSYCLSKERAEFTALFCLVGFSARKTYLLRVAELLVYSVVAILLGCALSYPTGNLFYGEMGLRFEEFSLQPKPVLIGTACLFFVSFLSPAIAERKEKKVSVKRETFRYGMVSLIVAAVDLGASYAVPTRAKFYVCLVGVVAMVLALSFLTEPLLSAFVRHIWKKKNSPSVSLAKKNCIHVGELTNSCRLLAVLLSVILAITFLVISAVICFPIYRKTISGEYIIAGGNSKTKEILETVEEIETVYSIRVANDCSLDDGTIIRLWGVDNLDVFAHELKGETLPQPGEFLCCTFMQEGYNLPRKNEFFIHEGKTVSAYRVSKTAGGMLPLFVTNYESITDATDYYVIQGKKEIGDAALYSAITSALSTQMVTVLPSAELMNHFIENNMKYACFCEIMLLALTVFGILGIGNNIFESFRSRKEELNSFLVCGMTKKQIKSMLSKEFGIILLLAVILGIITFLILTLIACNAVKTFAADIFGTYKAYFTYAI